MTPTIVYVSRGRFFAERKSDFSYQIGSVLSFSTLLFYFILFCFFFIFISRASKYKSIYNRPKIKLNTWEEVAGGKNGGFYFLLVIAWPSKWKRHSKNPLFLFFFLSFFSLLPDVFSYCFYSLYTLDYMNPNLLLRYIKCHFYARWTHTHG